MRAENHINSTGNWTTQPDAELFLNQVLGIAFEFNPAARKFADQLLDKVAVRTRDIIDHITFSDPTLIQQLQDCGWYSDEESRVFKNLSGFFPEFVLDQEVQRVYLRVDSVEDFLEANAIQSEIEGAKGSQLRRACAFKSHGYEFWVLERQGTATFAPSSANDHLIETAKKHQEILRSRKRVFDDVEEGFDHLDDLVDRAVEEIGPHWTCELFLNAEREYWMSRNEAGRIQKSRQDELGIGWANQDHHTFDSSRQHFFRTIRILEKLGFECRELFYAGADAGWGSQILEQPVLNSVIFADIDLAPEELDIDFAHDKNIKPLHPLRRAGLWCAMHGESMFEAGLNHLECMYDSKRFNQIFEELQIPMMDPFSDFPHLYQALTVGEWWPVPEEKIEELEKQGHISAEAASDFRQHGAIGSHFENLERNDGFKGFNQPGIDDVLRIIDPRKQLKSTAEI